MRLTAVYRFLSRRDCCAGRGARGLPLRARGPKRRGAGRLDLAHAPARAGLARSRRALALAVTF